MAEAATSLLESGDVRRFLTFRLDQRLFALPSEDVTEVIRMPSAARVPQAPKALLGIANLRGAVLPLASLRGLLNIDEAGTPGACAIVLSGASPAALAVDSIEALVTVASAHIETRQAELAAEPGEVVTAAFSVEGRGIAKVLDIRTLLDTAFARRAAHKPQTTLRAVTPGRPDRRSIDDDADVLVTFDVADQEYALAL